MRHVGGSDYELAPGRASPLPMRPRMALTWAAIRGDGSSFIPGISPAQFGLDRDKGVLFYNGGTGQGQVLPARVLMDWYGPGWRRKSTAPARSKRTEAKAHKAPTRQRT